MHQIPFNKPYLTGKEVHYLYQAALSGKLSGNGIFTKKCHEFFEREYSFGKCLLTSSCTDALEMAALLLDIKMGDEVIVPSFTFVSSALAFVRQGAKIVFADSYSDHPNIDPNNIEALITNRTKAIVVVHYAGVACDMDTIMNLGRQHNIAVVEDAAQAIQSFYKGRPLGGIGQFGCFSFHETKNIIAGEGGLFAINDKSFFQRAEIIWEKGTNRAEFFRGHVNKYGWVDTGSSFLPSELTASFLFAQLENIDSIQSRRNLLWNQYYNGLENLQSRGRILLPGIPEYATNNAHMFYLVCGSLDERTSLVSYLKENGVMAVFHYISLHSSQYYLDKHDGRPLPNSDNFTAKLLRLPMFYELTMDDVDRIINLIQRFYSLA
jgi:dTDP-4-amino-4,6-dideoxygalactose transaminase